MSCEPPVTLHEPSFASHDPPVAPHGPSFASHDPPVPSYEPPVQSTKPVSQSFSVILNFNLDVHCNYWVISQGGRKRRDDSRRGHKYTREPPVASYEPPVQAVHVDSKEPVSHPFGEFFEL